MDRWGSQAKRKLKFARFKWGWGRRPGRFSVRIGEWPVLQNCQNEMIDSMTALMPSRCWWTIFFDTNMCSGREHCPSEYGSSGRMFKSSQKTFVIPASIKFFLVFLFVSQFNPLCVMGTRHWQRWQRAACGWFCSSLSDFTFLGFRSKTSGKKSAMFWPTKLPQPQCQQQQLTKSLMFHVQFIYFERDTMIPVKPRRVISCTWPWMHIVRWNIKPEWPTRHAASKPMSSTWRKGRQRICNMDLEKWNTAVTVLNLFYHCCSFSQKK